MFSSYNSAITTSVEVFNGSANVIWITNPSAVTVTISGDTPAVANTGLVLAAGAREKIDLRANDLSRIVLNAVANSGTGAISIFAI